MSKGGFTNRSRYRKESLRKAADERRIYRESLSPKKQLERLDLRLGKGVGATKERYRLTRKIQDEKSRPKD